MEPTPTPPLRQRLYAAGPCTGRWPFPAKLVDLLPTGPAIVQLDATSAAVWALGSDGAVFKVETDAQARRPAAVRLRAPPGLLAVEQLACGTQHVLFLARTQASGSHAVYCYGDNSAGQCGIATSLRTVRVPTLVPAVSRQLAVKKLAAGSTLSAAVLSNGGVALWGGIEAHVGALPAIVTIPPAAFAGGSQQLHYASGRVVGSGHGGAQPERHGHGGSDEPLLPPGCATDVAVGSAHFVVGTSSTGVFEFGAPPLTQLDAATSSFSAASGVRGATGGGEGAAGSGGGGGGAAAPSADTHLRIRRVTDGPLWGVRPSQVAASGHTSYVLGSNGLVYAWGLLHREWVDPDERGPEGLAWRQHAAPDLVVSTVAQLASEGVIDCPISIRPRSAAPSELAVPSELMFTSVPHLVASGGGDRWEALAVAKTEARAGFDGDDGLFGDDGGGMSAAQIMSAELKRARMYDAIMACCAGAAPPWALCSVLGITQQHRLVPADGRVRLHRVAVPSPGAPAVLDGLPPVDMAAHPAPSGVTTSHEGHHMLDVAEGPLSAARPLLHELLPAFSVGAAAQCRDLVVWTGFEDAAVTPGALAAVMAGRGCSGGNDNAAAREAWLRRFAFSVEGLIVTPDADDASQWAPGGTHVQCSAQAPPMGLPPAWAMAPRMVDLDAALASDAAAAMRSMHSEHFRALAAQQSIRGDGAGSYLDAALRPLVPLEYELAAMQSSIDGCPRALLDDPTWLDAPLELLPTPSAPDAPSGGPPAPANMACETSLHAGVVLFRGALLEAANSELAAQHRAASAAAAAAAAAAVAAAAAAAVAEAAAAAAKPTVASVPAVTQLVASSARPTCDVDGDDDGDAAQPAPLLNPAFEALLSSVGSPGQRLKPRRRVMAVGSPLVSPGGSSRRGGGAAAAAEADPASPLCAAATCSYFRAAASVAVVITLELEGGGGGGGGGDDSSVEPLSARRHIGGSVLPAADTVDTVAQFTHLLCPLSWFEADPCFEHVCQHAFGPVWRRQLQAALCQLARERYDARVRRAAESGELTRLKRSRARAQSLDDAYVAALQLALGRRARMAGLLARLAGDFALLPPPSAPESLGGEGAAAALFGGSAHPPPAAAAAATVVAAPLPLSPLAHPLPRYSAHADVLATRVPQYFGRMLRSGMREAQVGRAGLPAELGGGRAWGAADGCPAAVVAFLRYVYTGVLVLPQAAASADSSSGGGGGGGGGVGDAGDTQLRVACALLAAADVCLLPDLRAACEQWLLARFATPRADAASLQQLDAFAASTRADRLRRHVTVVAQRSGALPFPAGAPAAAASASPRGAAALLRLHTANGGTSSALSPLPTARSAGSRATPPPSAWGQQRGLVASSSSVSLALGASSEVAGSERSDLSEPATARSDASTAGEDARSAFTGL